MTNHKVNRPESLCKLKFLCNSSLKKKCFFLYSLQKLLLTLEEMQFLELAFEFFCWRTELSMNLDTKFQQVFQI